MIKTALTDLLGITHPILNAPMASSATAELAGAVSASGGFGMLGMGNTVPDPKGLALEIKRVREITSNPFGVGFITSVPGIEKLVEVAIEAKVDLIGRPFTYFRKPNSSHRFARQPSVVGEGSATHRSPRAPSSNSSST